MEKFEWEASDSAPRKNVMRIISGGLLSPGGAQPVPDRSDLAIGWGRGASSGGGGLYPPPRVLDCVFRPYLPRIPA